MISESQNPDARRIADQVRRSWQGPAWHGPSVMEALEGVTPEIVVRVPASGGHSIWQITRHISVWTRIARQAAAGEPYPESLDSREDWPETKGEWADALAEFHREQLALVDAIVRFPDDRLSAVVTDTQRFNFYVLFQGVAQHNVYHAGQIAILKR